MKTGENLWWNSQSQTVGRGFLCRRLVGAVCGADQERVILTRGAAFEGNEAASGAAPLFAPVPRFFSNGGSGGRSARRRYSRRHHQLGAHQRRKLRGTLITMSSG